MKLLSRSTALLLCLALIFVQLLSGFALGDEVSETAAPAVVEVEEEAPEPTKGPTAEPTREPTKEPTAEPTKEPTAEPTKAPTAEPTKEPDSEPTFEPTKEPEAEPTLEPEVTDEPIAGPDVTDEPAGEPTDGPAVTEEPTAEPTEEPTAEPTPEPDAPPIEIKLTIANKCIFADTQSIIASLSASGGYGTVKVVFTIEHNGSTVYSTDPKSYIGPTRIVYKPTTHGSYIVTVTMVDELGNEQQATAKVLVAVKDSESEWQWKQDFRGFRPTGDWRADILTIARSQVGYEASETDFRMEDDGSLGYYTRYGDFMGEPYRDWCAMFVAFCVHYAGIPSYQFPYENKSDDLKKSLDYYYGAYEDDEDEYIPQPGDLIFFNWDGYDNPVHVGIIEKMDEYYVYTIEGNVGDRVVREKYRWKNESIVGYGNTEKLMRFNNIPVYYCGDYEHEHEPLCEIRPGYCGFVYHEHVPECANENNIVACRIPPHKHRDVCYYPPYGY